VNLRALPLSLALAATLASSAVPIAGGASEKIVVASIGDSIARKQAEIDATRKRLEEKRGQLRFQEVRAHDLQHQLDETNASIARVSGSLDGLSALVNSNQRKLAWNRVQLRAAQATLERHSEALRRRLVDAYEHGDLGYLTVLLSATSFSDFVERWDDIGYVIAANQRTVRERRAAERAVRSIEGSLESQRYALDASLARERQAKYQLDALASQRVQLVAAADAQRRSVATEVAQLEDLTAAQEAALEALIRERQRIVEERRAAESAARRRAAQLAGQAVPEETPQGAPGAFSWPVSGPITSPFGMRMHPVTHEFKMHTGIDIGAPTGATITAPADGRVIYAGWEGGYGNTIIIFHGGATSTLYGHCSQIFVGVNQDVVRGQAIGAVGMTGDATGPHLHFEIRENGVPVDPTTRLR
jgi:murein DD-endopeptidase MepM/ murein hydrolase activator NlpD